MGVKITKSQQKILDFVSDYIEKNGVSPTYREIADGLELRTVSTVAEHIDHLCALGVMKRSEDHGRVLEVVDLSFPETTSLFRSRMCIANEEEKAILRRAATILGIEGIEQNE